MRITTVIAGSLLVLAGCGSPTATEGTPVTQDTKIARQTSVERWSAADPCGLLPADEVKGYLGASASTGTKSEKFGRPQCTWTGAGRDKVDLLVWQPPDKGVVAGPSKKTLPVGGRTGYITVSTATSCRLEVDGGPAFLSMDVNAASQPPPAGGEDAMCKKVATTLTGVVGGLGW